MNLNNICLPSSSDVQAVGLPRKQSTTYHENVKSFLNSNQTSFVNLPSSIASHRLFEELYNLKNFSLPGCHTFPSSEDIFKWSVVLEGPTDTVYSNGIFFAELIFGVNYPFTAPEVIFRTKIYHCNINSQGQVCMGLAQNWKSIMGVVDVLKMLISLFYSCNPQNSLVPHIAEQYLHQFEEFEKMARIWTKRYAS